MHYSQPAPLLRFPFVYGDTLGGTISGNGRYCHTIPFTLEGISYVQVDASGRLILPDMTIENALRVHSKIRYTSRMNRRLTYVEEERYQWYSAYCRYPLLESIKSCTMTNRDTIYFASSYYLPQNQDTVLVREKDPDNITDAESESMITDVRYYPNPVSTELQIYYRLSQSAHVYVSMHYNGGITTYQSPVHQECVGEHMLPVNMGGMPIGNYVVYIHANDTVVSGNIIKY